MVFLIFFLSALIAAAQEKVIAGLKEKAPVIKKTGGWILIFIGIWLILISIRVGFFVQIFPV